VRRRSTDSVRPPTTCDLESFLRRCAKPPYVDHSAIVANMFLEANDVLFRKILYNNAQVLQSHVPT